MLADDSAERAARARRRAAAQSAAESSSSPQRSCLCTALGIDFKLPGARPTVAQQRGHEALRQLNYFVAFVHSTEEWSTLLEQHLGTAPAAQPGPALVQPTPIVAPQPLPPLPDLEVEEEVEEEAIAG